MALTLGYSSAETVSLEEYVERVNAEVDVEDIEQILSTAPLFAALLNNRSMIVDALNLELRKWREFQNRNHYSAQTFVLAASKKFVVRANVWMPPSGDKSLQKWEDKFYYYKIPHDHNFSFMTGGYYGSGYETLIYEYEHEQVVGLDEERVPSLRFLERTALPKGKIMFYRASKDIHSQEHPNEFSISVNLLVVNPKESLRTQYQFDLDRGIVSAPIQNRAAAQKMVCCTAAYLGDGVTASLLDDLSTAHPNARFRRDCIESLAKIEPSRINELTDRALRDNHPFVREALIAL